MFGEIEIGGFKKNFGRVHPGFMLEQDAHRNMAFTLYHAYHTPQLEFTELTVNDLGGGLQEVVAVVTNTRMTPTHAGIDLRHSINRPNYISLEGAGVVAGMLVNNRDLNVVEEQKVNPEKLEIPNIPGMDSVTVKWIIDGGRRMSVIVDSPKGGVVRKEL